MRSPESLQKVSEKMKQWWSNNPQAKDRLAVLGRRNAKPTTKPKSCRMSDKAFEEIHILAPDGLKRCKDCNLILPFNQFWKSGYKENLQRRCKGCAIHKQADWRKIYKDPSPEKVRARSKKWREAHPELAKQRIKDCYFRNPEVYRQRSRLRRAVLRSNDPKQVTLKDLDRMLKRQGGLCYLCHKSLCVPEIEHIIPVKRGGRHSIGNLAWACKKCNRLKWTSLLSEYRYA